MNNHVLIIHDVDDYIAWKEIFDAAAAIRKQAGELSYQVLRAENNPNKIIHFSKWISLSNAKAFFESDELVALRIKAGVKAPEFVYSVLIEEGEL